MPCDHAADKIQAPQYSKITDFASNFFTESGKTCDFAGHERRGHFYLCKW